MKPCLLLYENGTGCPEGNKCINSHCKKWDEKLKETANRCYVCGLKRSKATNANQPHQSEYCRAPGGGEDIERIRDRVNMWIYKELPLRPGNVRTSLPKEERKDRQRSKSPTRRRSQEQEGERYGPGFSAWDIGEAEGAQRHKLMKTLRSARKELTEKLQLTES